MLTFPDVFFPGAAGNWQEIMSRGQSPNDLLNKAADDALIPARPRVDAIKQPRQASALDEARAALAQLGAADKTASGRLVRSLDPDHPPALS